MAFILSVFLLNVFCAWFQCEVGPKAPFVHVNPKNTEILLKSIISGQRDSPGRSDENSKGPIVLTKLGLVEGYAVNISEFRQIYSFTGIPYGEPPQRFGAPVPKRPWKGILQAKSDSPFCVQVSTVLMGFARGQEDCLYLDIHTPRLPDRQRNPEVPKPPGLPVIVVLPAGTNMYGRSLSHGPAYLLREDVIFVPLNVRFGIFGYLSTGDEASPGNYALKDQSLAIKWIYDNIEAFGGDPQKIIVAGISSGGYTSHMMLFTKHETRNYVRGIIAISGSALANHGLDAVGRVRNASNLIAEWVGCPTSDQGKSWAMVECMRKLDPHKLAHKQFQAYKRLPYLSRMLGPTLEPDLPNAFISELPEVQYEKGIVPRIPVIFSRTEDENGLMLQFMRYNLLQAVTRNWYDWMPQILQLGVRSAKGQRVSYDQSQLSLLKVNRFYFNKTTPPRFAIKKDINKFVDLINDNLCNAPMWKAVELHHKIAPTYVYLQKHNTYEIFPIFDLVHSFFSPMEFGSSHATDVVLLFNYTVSIPPLSQHQDFEKASRNLINMIANFASFGKPLYRTNTGAMVDVWKPVTDMRRLTVLDVGLVHNISMTLDPLQDTGRLKIWDDVQF